MKQETEEELWPSMPDWFRERQRFFHKKVNGEMINNPFYVPKRSMFYWMLFILIIPIGIVIGITLTLYAFVRLMIQDPKAIFSRG